MEEETFEISFERETVLPVAYKSSESKFMPSRRNILNKKTWHAKKKLFALKSILCSNMF